MAGRRREANRKAAVRSESAMGSRQDALLPEVAAALSHDIKGVVGTVGRKARILAEVMSRTAQAAPSHDLRHAKELIDIVSDLYEKTECIRDKIRTQEIVDRPSLESAVYELMLPRVAAIQQVLNSITASDSYNIRSRELYELRRSVYRLEKIIRSLISLIGVGQTSVFQITNLHNHVRMAQEAISHQFETVGASLTVQGGASILADQGSLLSIFINMFDNSIKYCVDGREIRIDVRIQNVELKELRSRYPKIFDECYAPSIWALISVSDNGMGIPQKDWNSVFELGVRASTAELNNEEGLGLGLTRCRYIMRAHNGFIFVSESSTSGTTFELLFPFDPTTVGFSALTRDGP